MMHEFQEQQQHEELQNSVAKYTISSAILLLASKASGQGTTLSIGSVVIWHKRRSCESCEISSGCT